MLIAKKVVENTTQGEYQIVKTHILKVDDITLEELEDIYMDASEFEDPEDAYLNGVIIDYDNDVWIDVDNFLGWIEQYINETIDEDEEDIYHDITKLLEMQQKLKKYEGYTLIPKKNER